MTTKEKIIICDKAIDIINEMNGIDDWYFLDLVKSALQSADVTQIEIVKEALIRSVKENKN